MATSIETSDCPNCGYHAQMNYCAQCGQTIKPHSDRFLELTKYFIKDYVRFDSKFWMTLRTLWSHPGKLTVAYWNKQRKRFLLPLSLYFFVSAVYFIPLYTLELSDNAIKREFVIGEVEAGPSVQQKDDGLWDASVVSDSARLLAAPSRRDSILQKLTSTGSREDAETEVLSQIFQGLPKLFFFMIPVMSLTLGMLFRKRRELLFVHHAVFSVHLHSFAFTIFLIPVLIPFGPVKEWTEYAIGLVSIVYLIIALRGAYGLSWGRSVSYSAAIGTSYAIAFLLAFVLYAILVFLYLAISA